MLLSVSSPVFNEMNFLRAGVPSIYSTQCASAGPTGSCVSTYQKRSLLQLTYVLLPQYQDNVVGPGSPKYDNAFFEISYVRTYTTSTAAAPPGEPTTIGTGTLTVSSQTTSSVSASSSDSASPTPTSNNDNTSAATAESVSSYWVLLVALACVSAFPLLL